MDKSCEIGVIGLAVMGQNLVLNMEEKGHSVVVFNRTTEITEKFVKERGVAKNIKGVFSLEELVESLEKPRKIMLMVKAGKAVDIVIDNLVPLLEQGDIIIDGGNSHFQDTNARDLRLKDKGIRYLGTGISGGEYGALHGPSIMPGGDKTAYNDVSNILTKIAAKTDSGACVTYLGPNSAGHYVKMVHNGIEYGVMEVISEIYDIMRNLLKKTPLESSNYFKEWNKIHQSYLMEITQEILAYIDPDTNKPIIDVILDKAKQKGTGKWSVQDALDLGVAIPTITAGVNARCLSGLKEERQEIAKALGGIQEIKSFDDSFIDDIENTLYVATLIAYAEGMKLLAAASEEYNYNLNLEEIARIWEDGCIIRSSLLKGIQKAYQEDSQLINLIVSKEFKDDLKERIPSFRKVVSKVKEAGLAIPALNMALDYYDSLRQKDLPANLIQAQRDYFGAHTYERKDKRGAFHTEWQDIHNIT